MMISMMLAGIASEHWNPRTIGAIAGALSSTTAIFWGWAEFTGRLPEPARAAWTRRRSKFMESRTSDGGLAGHVVLVTGAARRIGRGIALRLAEEGARVVIHYHLSEAEARRTAEQCGGAAVVRANLESVAEIAACSRKWKSALDGWTAW